jgi:hypothetical protein
VDFPPLRCDQSRVQACSQTLRGTRLIQRDITAGIAGGLRREWIVERILKMAARLTQPTGQMFASQPSG